MDKKQEIICEIKRVANELGKTALSSAEFQRHSKISLGTIRNHFVSWTGAVQEAGLSPIDKNEALRRSLEKTKIPENDLLKDLMLLYNQFGKEPTQALVNSKGNYSTQPYRKNWGSVKKAFELAKQKFPDDFSIPVSPQVKSSHCKQASIQEEPKSPRIAINPGKKKTGGTVYGEAIDFRGLRHAPVNEQGVIFLFGMVSQELGFSIESARTVFPDCEGKQTIDKHGRSQSVKIEFEYKSSNFREHGHNENECDIIVCWIHDWADCPLDVIELKSKIEVLK